MRRVRAGAPMLPLDIFRSRSVSTGTLLVIIGFIGLFGVLFFITLYLQNVHHYSAVQTGVKMLPLTATFIISPLIGSGLTQRLGPRPPAVIGMALLGVSFLGLTGLEVHSPSSSLWPWFVGIGAALGLIITSTTQAIVGNVSVARGGIAGGLQSTANQLGGVLGATAAAVLAHKDIVGSGIAPISAQMPHQLQQAITTASNAERGRERRLKLQPHHLVEEHLRLVGGEPQVRRPHLHELAACTQAGQREGRDGPGSHRERDLRGQVVQDEGRRLVYGGPVDDVVVVERHHRRTGEDFEIVD